MKRALIILAGWGLLFWASPGIAGENGSLLLAVLGVGVVGAGLLQPLGERRRRALVLEWAAGGIGATFALWWVYFVAPPALLFVAAVLGLYQLIAGFLIRRLALKLSIGPAVALGWLGAETLRTVLIPPLGLGWLLLGHHTSHHLWLAGSARVWGVEGLSLVVAALGGLLAQLMVERKITKGGAGLAAGALLLGVVLSASTKPVPMLPGPTAMVIQPGFSQEEKRNVRELLPTMFRLSLEGLRENQARSGPPVDFVAWGESMLRLPIAETGVRDALAQGLNLPPWRQPLDLKIVDSWGPWLEQDLQRPFLSRLPSGTHLLTGVEVYDVLDGRIENFVGTALFGPAGRLGPVAKKRNLVPGGETMLGLERFGWVREAVMAAIGYTPDLRPGSETGILELPGLQGRSYRMAAMACFDNAFAEPVVEALAAGPVDFHVLTSNEAWYQDACEMDQMMAFSRILAICTGRSYLRATNSGISALIGPDGREIKRLWVGDSDRSVRGNLVVSIPVPEDPEAGGTIYVALRGFLRWGIALFLGALLWFCRGARPALA
jgi:apolipoprotein N-acyltransferase